MFLFLQNLSPITVEAQEGDSIVLSAPSVYSETGFLWLLPSGAYIVSSIHIRAVIDDGIGTGTGSDTTDSTQSGGSDNSGNADSTTVTPDTTSEASNNNDNGETTNGVSDSSNNNGDTTTAGASSTANDNSSSSSAVISTAYTSESQLNYTNEILSSAYSIDSINGALTIKTVSSSATGTSAGATVGEYKLQSAHGTVSFTVRIDDNDTSSTNATTAPTDNISALPNSSSIAVSYYVCLGAILVIVITMFLLFSYVFRKNKKKPHYRTEHVITPDNTKQF